jgi:hypothetical protein
MPLTLGRQISEFKGSLVYRVNSRTARATQRNPVLKNQKGEKRKRRGEGRGGEGRGGEGRGGEERRGEERRGEERRGEERREEKRRTEERKQRHNNSDMTALSWDGNGSFREDGNVA